MFVPFLPYILSSSLRPYFTRSLRDTRIELASRNSTRFSLSQGERKLASHLQTASPRLCTNIAGEEVSPSPRNFPADPRTSGSFVSVLTRSPREYFHFRLAALPCDAHRPAEHLNTFVPRDSDINHHANLARAPVGDCEASHYVPCLPSSFPFHSR